MPAENNVKILVVDDEEILRERLKRLLELDDYEVNTAESGPKGLEEFARFGPDIVLLDIKMPGMDGIEVLDRLKQLPHQAEVFMLTGHGGLETAIEALRKGAFDYMTKPIDYDELEINLKRALEKKALRLKLATAGELVLAAGREVLPALAAMNAGLEVCLARPAAQNGGDPELASELANLKSQLAALEAIASRLREHVEPAATP
ncbi:MAG: response regulator [Candidatus Omnitrophica bacterium]|nr:response regulator [Candidatus Omnitrophota bacterium]